MEERIMVSKRKIQRGAVLEKVVEGTFTLKKGSELMKISYRQVIRLMNEYRSSGLRGIVHGNRGRSPANKVNKKSRDRIVKLAQGKYFGFNDSHLREKLTEEEGMKVSRETLRKILRDRGIAPKSKRRPRRHLSRRPRRSEMGALMQMDGKPAPLVWRRSPVLLPDACGR